MGRKTENLGESRATYGRIAIVIPCFNESGSIRSLLQEINAVQISNYKLDCIVVNDHSEDDTFDQSRKEKAIVLDLPVNLGIGGAVQTGFKYALKEQYDIAIQVDGDGQHNPSYIQNLVEGIKAGNNLVIGSRYIQKKGFQSTKLRKSGIKIISFIIHQLTGLKITDPTSGFRAYDHKAISFVCEHYPDDFPEPVSIIQLNKRKFKIEEIPVEMRERMAGISSIQSFKSAFYMVKVCMALIFNRI